MNILKDNFPSIEIKIRISGSELQQYLKEEYYPCSEIITEDISEDVREQLKSYTVEWSESEIKSTISEDVWEQLKRFIGDAEVKIDIIKEN